MDILKFSIIMLLCCGAFLAHAAEEANTNELVFDAEPYIAFFNKVAGEKVRKLKQEYPQYAGRVQKERFPLTRGKHTLTVSGREPGSEIERLFIGKVGTAPEKGEGIHLLAINAVLTAPMALHSPDGKERIVGGKDAGLAVWEFQIEEEGEYCLWGKVIGANEHANSFFVAIDQNSPLTWGYPVAAAVKWAKVIERGPDYLAVDSFWYTWASTMAASHFRDDAELRPMAYAMTELGLQLLAKRNNRPLQLWFMRDLETVYMWQQDGRMAPEKVDSLLRLIKPHVDGCFAMTQTEVDWHANTPNIQLQAAAILRLGAVMWETGDPETSSKWAMASEACLARAWQYKRAGGGFGYSYGSGMDSGYLAEDMEHLTRYWMLTHDRRVGEALKDMAGVTRLSNRCGMPITFGAPWWKHVVWNYNAGKKALAESVLHLSESPDYATLVQYNRERVFAANSAGVNDILMTYYNSCMPQRSIRPTPLADGCAYSDEENGPVLRYGGLNVGMPYRSWCESTCGATYSSPTAVESSVASVILAAVLSDPEGRKSSAHYPVAYSVVDEKTSDQPMRMRVMGKGFIATATVFRPALGGPAIPPYVTEENRSPWQRTDIHFADNNGVASHVELQALQDNNCSKVVLWAHVSDQLPFASGGLKITGNQIRLPGLSIHLDNTYADRIRNLGKTWGYAAGWYPLSLLECVVRDAPAAGFKKGDAFTADVSIDVEGSRGLSILSSENAAGVRRVSVCLAGQPHALLVFNGSAEPAVHTADPGFAVACQSTPSGETKEIIASLDNIELPVGSLTVFMTVKP